MSGPIRVDVDPAGIPDDLRDRDVWVCWKVVIRDGKPDKRPVNPKTGANASVSDPTTWVSLARALAYHERGDTNTAGIGYMFASGGPFAGVDLDNCRDPDTEEIDAWARDVLDTLDTFAEVSPSGTGVHAFVRGDLPDGGNRRGDVEMYDTDRFFTVTGAHVGGTPTTINDRQDELDAVHAEYVASDRGTDPAEDGSPGSNRGVTAGKPPSGDGFDGSDADLVEKAKAAEDGEKFADLWAGRWEHHGYPSHSEARMALLCKLAFWTGKDARRMDGLFRDSGLCPHPSDPGKWDRLGDGEIAEAIAFTPDVYEPPRADGAPGEATRPDGGGDWNDVRANFVSSERGTTGRAQADAADLLVDEFDLLTAKDNGDLFRYDSGAGIYRPDGVEHVRGRLSEVLGNEYSRNRVGEILHRIRSDTYVDRDDLGASEDRPLVCVGNGVLDLSEFADPAAPDPKPQFRDHSHDHRLLTNIPVEYDPNADCPAFDAFLRDVLESDADRRTVYELFGYCLWPGYPFAKAFLLYGDGSNGKSTLLDVLERFLGGETNVSSRELYDLENDEFAAADLYGRMANIAGDLPDRRLESTGTIKTLTGGDLVTANPKFLKPFSFKNRAKLVFAANDPPQIDDDSAAIYRRLLLLNFPNEFTPPGEPGPDARPRHELMGEIASDAELSGILNAALDGLARLFETGRFSQNETTAEVREHYKKVSNPIYAFVKECVEESTRDDAEIGKDELYNLYTKWATEHSAPKKEDNVFHKEFKKHVRAEDKRVRRNGDRVRLYQGIRLTGRGVEIATGGGRDDDGWQVDLRRPAD